ncbi:deoxyribodipyrimidine photo-lyase [Winogradskyella forsetii]|uniref:deoxyribodipyrimidine photo-lyase n=1 Tax=Winogradskyella forsetii TaxID=2686077 RepID=UPI001E3D70AC|nr:deoxyribodipyrimidine photo-lyase [Winogradskyella forsetii]
MKTGLVWFKNDLRLHDNEALCAAIAECDELVLCYSVEPFWFENLPLDFKKANTNRFKFLEQSISNLQKNLEAIDGHLIIGNRGAVIDIPKLIKIFHISTIYAEQEYAKEEEDLIRNLKNVLPDIDFQLYWGKTFYHIDDIPFSIADIPLTSKAYRIPTSKESSPRPTFKAPENINAHPDATSNKFPDYKLFGFTKEAYEAAKPYLEGGEDKALERLRYYTFESELLTGYRWSRNQSIGMDYSSKFSPYLALGCISARLIYEAIKDYEEKIKKNQSTWWLVFELVWRDYFTFKGMRMGNAIFFTKGYKNKTIDFENDTKKFERWRAVKPEFHLSMPICANLTKLVT